MSDFEEFPKIARLSRDIVITEKIDGTNAQVYIRKKNFGICDEPTDELLIFAGSRSRWLTTEDDNFGFARWVEANKEDLLKLGEGRHFGEWWGSGIQRGYGLKNGDKRFSLFNVHRWGDAAARPACCSVVPTLYRGTFCTDAVVEILELLEKDGSTASPGFMKPEGIIIFHTAANMMFKKTIDKDEEPKGKTQ